MEVWRSVWISLIVLIVSLAPCAARAELQFDIFVGYDSVVREAGWFPISVEIANNEGPAFNAVVEISVGSLASDAVRQVPVEIPNNTRKRLTIPIFSTGGRGGQWIVRLIDQRGKVRAERTAQTKPLAWEGFLLGSISRSYAGSPILAETNIRRDEMKPQIARIQPDVFPDNPIALEGLSALYINSEKAISLKIPQVAALLSWVNGGGHLVLGVEQIADVNATPWLHEFLPCEFTDMINVTVDRDLQQWLNGDEAEPSRITKPGGTQRARRTSVVESSSNPFGALGADPAFKKAQLPVATGKLRKGATVQIEAEGKPLIVSGHRGRGKLTVLAFSPEREPFRSWKNRGAFWAKLVEMPPEWISGPEINAFGGWSVDAIFGALIDSRQIRKLPIEWLLALLVVYLVVIGPFDQWWLKKINRQMLTWITFPTYVVLFSLLIYFIGYKLRAGETEWNEVHLVDILPRGDRAELRGRTFVSIYSSANATYPIASEQPFATFRGELLDLYGGGKEGSKARVEQRGNNFVAEIDVPVWTSLLYVNDWLQPASTPLSVNVSIEGDTVLAVVHNSLDRPLTDCRVVLKTATHAEVKVYELGSLSARQEKRFTLKTADGTALSSFVQSNSIQRGTSFRDTVDARRNSFGNNRQGQLENPAMVSTVASFTAHIPTQQNQRRFVTPAGVDLTSLVDRGDAVLLAWDADHSPIKPINQFKPIRTRRSTLLRLAAPVAGVN
ncbi:MAG: hypothetical protein EXS31_04735 [Pedosphaera sp.]|nr:hypothetical protein [Pedosphaera sp.]